MDGWMDGWMELKWNKNGWIKDKKKARNEGRMNARRDGIRK